MMKKLMARIRDINDAFEMDLIVGVLVRDRERDIVL